MPPVRDNHGARACAADDMGGRHTPSYADQSHFNARLISTCVDLYSRIKSLGISYNLLAFPATFHYAHRQLEPDDDTLFLQFPHSDGGRCARPAVRDAAAFASGCLATQRSC